MAWVLEKVGDAMKVASFVNLLFFMLTENYRSILERLLGMRLVVKDAS